MKKLLVAVSFVCFCTVAAFAQNSNSSTVDPSAAPSTRTRTTAPPKPSPTPRTVTKPATEVTPSPTPRPARTETSGGQTSPSGDVLAAFNALLEGIRNADVKAVTNAYQNTPRLLLFNYNG